MDDDDIEDDDMEPTEEEATAILAKAQAEVPPDDPDRERKVMGCVVKAHVGHAKQAKLKKKRDAAGHGASAGKGEATKVGVKA